MRSGLLGKFALAMTLLDITSAGPMESEVAGTMATQRATQLKAIESTTFRRDFRNRSDASFDLPMVPGSGAPPPSTPVLAQCISLFARLSCRGGSLPRLLVHMALNTSA